MKSFYSFSDALTLGHFMVREDYNANSPSGFSSKSVYFMPSAVRALLSADRDGKLKVVCAGIKALEKKVHKITGAVDYRLVQDGASALLPYIQTRKVFVTVQDFSNLLEGGLVSFSTLSSTTVQALSSISSGGVIAVYKFNSSDIIRASSGTGDSSSSSVVENTAEKPVDDSSVHTEPATACQGQQYPEHYLNAICWRGNTRTLNVMCGKVEIESMKHQLAALRVLR